MMVLRGVMMGFATILLSACQTTRTLECTQDQASGLMRCTEVIDTIRH